MHRGIHFYSFSKYGKTIKSYIYLVNNKTHMKVGHVVSIYKTYSIMNEDKQKKNVEVVSTTLLAQR